MAGRLKGKRAVVVGGGQSAGETLGFGRATALLFAREGAEVALVDRDHASAADTRQMIADEGGTATVYECDITNEAHCALLATQLRSSGGLDVLYNGVGILGYGAPTDLTEADWDTVMDVNLKGMWMTCKHLLPLMLEQGRGGSIVNISSIGALRGLTPAYCASKAGVNALTTVLAGTYAPDDIRVNAIMPGMIDTPMGVDHLLARRGGNREELVAQRAERVPMAYKGSAWDIAFAALYFASDESRYTSGAILPVDGAVGAVAPSIPMRLASDG